VCRPHIESGKYTDLNYSAGLDPSRASTGVVWTTERAYEHGFLENPEEWANLGQGAPEVDDDIEGCFERPHTIDISMTGREYVCTPKLEDRSNIDTGLGSDCRHQTPQKSRRRPLQRASSPGQRKPVHLGECLYRSRWQSWPYSNCCGLRQRLLGFLYSRLHCLQ